LATNTLQAKRYAQAAFEIAIEQKEIDKWQSDLQKIAILAQSKDFVSVMDNPKYSFEDKVRLLNNQLKGTGEMALNLAYILTKQNSFGLILLVYSNFQDLLDEHRGITKAEITTAIPLDEDERVRLAERLGDITGKKILLTEKIEPDIFGGIIVRVEGRIIDGSTRNRLAILKNELASAGI
jgi:F-type H+-transporting ATPase subunit delta